MKRHKNKSLVIIFTTMIFYSFFCSSVMASDEDWEEARAMIQSGKDFEKSGQYEKATDIFKKIVTQFPGYADGHLQLGFGLQALKQFNPAIESYKQGLDLSPYHKFAAEAYYNMSVSADKLGRGADAIDYLKKALQAYTDRNDYASVFQVGSYLEVLSNKYPEIKSK
jgi:tetratricopeptide (TPR) repeat protein